MNSAILLPSSDDPVLKHLGIYHLQATPSMLSKELNVTLHVY